MNDTATIRAENAHYVRARAEHVKRLFDMRAHLRRLILQLKGIGVSQQMIARKIGKSQSRISQWMQRPQDRAQYDGGCGEADLARAINILCQMLDDMTRNLKGRKNAVNV